MFNTELRSDVALTLNDNLFGGATTLIADKIFYPYSTSEKGGTVSLARYLADGGTKNRTAGSALSGTRVSPVDVNFSCDLYEGRAWLTQADVKDLGGDDPAIVAGAKVASRGAYDKIETDAAAAVFTSAAISSALPIASADGFDGLLKAAQSVKHYGNNPTLVCSETFFNKWVSLPAVRSTLVDLYGHAIIGNAIAGADDAFKAIGAAFGCKGIIIGDDNYWQKSGTSSLSAAEYAAVINLPPVEDNALTTSKAIPVFGVQSVFVPENGSKWQIETGYDVNTKRNIVDATLQADMVVANDGARKCVYIA